MLISAIIEPRGGKVVDSTVPSTRPFFDDTQFPVNHSLSQAFGSFLGNDNATYIIVAIRKATQYQQQVSRQSENDCSIMRLIWVLWNAGHSVVAICLQGKRPPEYVYHILFIRVHDRYKKHQYHYKQ